MDNSFPQTQANRKPKESGAEERSQTPKAKAAAEQALGVNAKISWGLGFRAWVSRFHGNPFNVLCRLDLEKSPLIGC